MAHVKSIASVHIPSSFDLAYPYYSTVSAIAPPRKTTELKQKQSKRKQSSFSQQSKPFGIKIQPANKTPTPTHQPPSPSLPPLSRTPPLTQKRPILARPLKPPLIPNNTLILPSCAPPFNLIYGISRRAADAVAVSGVLRVPAVTGVGGVVEALAGDGHAAAHGC